MTRPVPRRAGLFDKLLPPGGITLTLCLVGNQQRRMPPQIARREPQIPSGPYGLGAWWSR